MIFVALIVQGDGIRNQCDSFSYSLSFSVVIYEAVSSSSSSYVMNSSSLRCLYLNQKTTVCKNSAMAGAAQIQMRYG